MIRPSAGAFAGALLVGGAVFAGCAFFGVELMFALAWGAAVSVVVGALRMFQPGDLPAWPPQPPEDDRVGVSDVARLAWTISPASGAPGRSAVLRVTDVLRRRLRVHGLELDDPHDAAPIDALLGAGVRAGLLSPHPSVAALEAAVSAAEKLAPEIQENI
ncbi:hypothetical protein [Microbacterium nymphoidis]|uniref:hypothetical protein n=1 Tax=Microbacterium nymphoidis TaxID=2898586 RepID=UPI001E316956|nr:hypothetical protein [Microbacterium nymphoidis]MCD2497277.1 hypothetical protein [Microbacterium nymphoidis]